MNQDMENSSFLGTGWSFPPEFNRAGKQNKMVSNEEDIRQSLTILLGTKPGERIMQPTFGCGIHKYVFENYDESLATVMKEAIRIAILYFETRIKLDGINIDQSQTFNGILLFEIEYTIKATNSRTNMVFPFYLLEGTNISENEK